MRAGRDSAEESYGDFQLVVDAIADRLLGLRDTYARTLDDDAPSTYREAFAAGVARRFRRYASRRGRPRALTALVQARGRSSLRGRSERASLRWPRASSRRPWLRSARPSA